MVTGGRPGTRKAVFLDRDGVIVRPEFRDGRSFAPRTLEEFALLPGVAPTLEALKKAGYLLIVVTNQPDVGRGKMQREVLDRMHQSLMASLPLDDIFVCAHAQDAGCGCRKPAPGLLLAAADKWQIDFQRSFMIGDRRSDIEAGEAVGCRTIFVDYNYLEYPPDSPNHRVASLSECVAIVLQH